MVKDWLHSFMKETKCPVCKGKRLNPQALSVRVGNKNISEFTALSVVNAKQFISSLSLDVEKAKIADLVIKEIDNRLSFLHNVGLDYLTLRVHCPVVRHRESDLLPRSDQGFPVSCMSWMSHPSVCIKEIIPS